MTWVIPLKKWDVKSIYNCTRFAACYLLLANKKPPAKSWGDTACDAVWMPGSSFGRQDLQWKAGVGYLLAAFCFAHLLL